MEISSSGRFQRQKAVCVITQGGEYLFFVGVDPLGQRSFLVPVGGATLSSGTRRCPQPYAKYGRRLASMSPAPPLGVLEKFFLTRSRRTTRWCSISSARCGRGTACRRKGLKAMALASLYAGSQSGNWVSKVSPYTTRASWT